MISDQFLQCFENVLKKLLNCDNRNHCLFVSNFSAVLEFLCFCLDFHSCYLSQFTKMNSCSFDVGKVVNIILELFLLLCILEKLFGLVLAKMISSKKYSNVPFPVILHCLQQYCIFSKFFHAVNEQGQTNLANEYIKHRSFSRHLVEENRMYCKDVTLHVFASTQHCFPWNSFSIAQVTCSSKCLVMIFS